MFYVSPLRSHIGNIARSTEECNGGWVNTGIKAFPAAVWNSLSHGVWPSPVWQRSRGLLCRWSTSFPSHCHRSCRLEGQKWTITIIYTKWYSYTSYIDRLFRESCTVHGGLVPRTDRSLTTVLAWSELTLLWVPPDTENDQRVQVWDVKLNAAACNERRLLLLYTASCKVTTNWVLFSFSHCKGYYCYRARQAGYSTTMIWGNLIV